MDFISALRERGVPEENLTQMEEDKIDPAVVRLLNEEELSKYISRYGDRVFAKTLAHTCSQHLELASDYSTYAKFRVEFSSVLNSGVWVMDMS